MFLLALTAFGITCFVADANAGAAVSSLVSKSKAIDASVDLRQLQDNNNGYEYYPYDLSTFSVRYEKCQYVMAYDDELAADEDYDSPLAMKHFVLFRMCPTDDCETCNSETYGKYMTEIDEYLEFTVEQQKQIFENMCENCDEECGDGQECYSRCGQECSLYENMEDSGLMDASEFIECQEFEIPDNDEGRRLRKRLRRRKRKLDEEQDDDEEQDEELEYFIGPRCSGTGIAISLFSDENCWNPLDDVNVGDYFELSYYFLEHTFVPDGRTSGSLCLTCAENDENKNDNDNNDADRVNEMCEKLYDEAAKCETPTGITSGFIQMKREDGQYENKVETEFLSCSFIDSLLWNSYTEEGKIDYVSRPDVYVRHVTTLQAGALGGIAVAFVGLLALMNYLQKRIAEVKSKSNLKSDSRAVWA